MEEKTIFVETELLVLPHVFSVFVDWDKVFVVGVVAEGGVAAVGLSIFHGDLGGAVEFDLGVGAERRHVDQFEVDGLGRHRVLLVVGRRLGLERHVVHPVAETPTPN